MTEHVHEWELVFKPDSFRRVRCKYCPEQMLDFEIEQRLNEYETLKADKRLLMHVVHGRAMASSLPKHLKEE